MKFSALLLAAGSLLAVSCQRIPPSVSIPGYGEKEAAVEKEEHHPLGTSGKPPAYFPSQGGQ
ncbi:MAG: hypothetical protein JHD33_03520 [Chthoniobacterales bacterium]|jgi:hypothetical protein|nr:hypothetical protein [Chthoniobacterales bacterium]